MRRVDVDVAEPRPEPGDVLPQDLGSRDGEAQEGAEHGLGHGQLQ